MSRLVPLAHPRLGSQAAQPSAGQCRWREEDSSAGCKYQCEAARGPSSDFQTTTTTLNISANQHVRISCFHKKIFLSDNFADISDNKDRVRCSAGQCRAPLDFSVASHRSDQNINGLASFPWSDS